uniref:Uncharacterized protein n=1 Tax=Romanomermis culicivorax TaxID=13658 RepID=A0A915L4R2_ROMCU
MDACLILYETKLYQAPVVIRAGAGFIQKIPLYKTYRSKFATLTVLDDTGAVESIADDPNSWAITRPKLIPVELTVNNATPQGGIAQQAPQISTAAPPMTPAVPLDSGQVSNPAISSDADASAVLQLPPPQRAANLAIDPNMDCTDSTNSFINLDPLLARTPALVTARSHCSSIAIANANEVQNFCLEACDALEQLNNTAARIMNNVQTIQTIDQIISVIFDKLQAQQLQVQCKIKEQAQATNG